MAGTVAFSSSRRPQCSAGTGNSSGASGPFGSPSASGRPPLAPALADLIERLARENPTWGYGRIQGELAKLDYRVGRSTIRDLLQRQHVPPAPQRRRHGLRWRTFLRHYQEQALAADFFTVETVLLQTIFVLL